ncbi:putative pectin lyase F [Lasiodiplodia hormozganensis]|uniref:pectin lyase n=1 Tax=Lasiodiplodia hormozganensis TaxID=869390 RepID=A0AA39XU97_9PEZI|nr:putative pectin lyase F [Lasiodiplodia hormozganensis]
MHLNSFLLALTAVPAATLAQVVGTPYGFAKGVTGGGNATPAKPSNIAQLKEWLADDTPRVIMIDKTFDFANSEGTATGTACRPTGTSACTGSFQKQDWIQDTCESYQQKYTATWDKAAATGMPVASNKSIVGVGSKGVLNGKGLVLKEGAKNIIIQNIHITNLNPKYVWGGDAISINGVDGVWIDHCKAIQQGWPPDDRDPVRPSPSTSNPTRSLTPPPFPSYSPSRVTISNNEFDGVTTYSSTCNNDHYWTTMLVGDSLRLTLDRNYFHDVSGRSPKIGGSGTQLVQASNNYFANCAGHNFDVAQGGSVLIEGNRFEGSDQPVTSGSKSNGGATFNVPDANAANTCSSYLGRKCQINALSSSGEWYSLTNTAPLQALGNAKDYLVTPIAYGNVKSTVLGAAGIGKIGN